MTTLLYILTLLIAYQVGKYMGMKDAEQILKRK